MKSKTVKESIVAVDRAIKISKKSGVTPTLTLRRYLHALLALDDWERRFARAEKRMKYYKRKVRYYQKKIK